MFRFNQKGFAAIEIMAVGVIALFLAYYFLKGHSSPVAVSNVPNANPPVVINRAHPQATVDSVKNSVDHVSQEREKALDNATDVK